MILPPIAATPTVDADADNAKAGETNRAKAMRVVEANYNEE